ncbi:MAG: DUF1993 family protein [Rickettsiales bacterium]|nr:DUF1993 family protein [Rickettsiales bacterium]
MTISMYQSSVPVFINKLENLSAILDKGATDAEARKIDPSVFVNARIAPTMFPLSRQVQIACDAAKAGAARLAGIELPVFEDIETTFPQLKERIAKTIKFLQSIDAAKIDGSEDLKITYTQRGKESNFIGQPYLINYVLPNLYFHITASYLILRHNGVEVGKRDFLGNL